MLLFAMTDSVILPVKTVLMNLLSIGAAFGILVLIFQDGRLEGLLAYESQGALNLTQPILLFSIAFALSTDYAIVLLIRIKEGRDADLPNQEAVARGLERTGRIVIAAALLFAVAIGAFSTSQIVFIKMLGLGVALTVLIDATSSGPCSCRRSCGCSAAGTGGALRPLRRLHDRIGLTEGEPALES